MNNDEWIPIRYRDFYDVPRAFVIHWNGQAFFFDCPFNDELGDFPDHYTVIRLKPSAAASLEDTPWQGMENRGSVIAHILVKDVQLDATRREAVHASVLDLL